MQKKMLMNPMRIASLLKSSAPLVMGILNTTPDSFSDGGDFFYQGKFCVDAAVEKALHMVKCGAHIIDIGGCSTRPGSKEPSIDEECFRTISTIEYIRKVSDVYISIDTSRAEVMRIAVEAGANMINDIYALQRKGSMSVASEMEVDICLMHLQGNPQSMQINPQYQDVILEVKEYLDKRVKDCLTHGIIQERLVLDVGFGFGKSAVHNINLFKALHTFSENYPLLVGISRKSMLNEVVECPVAERGMLTELCHILALQQGAKILRAHDVQAAINTIKIWKSYA